MKQGELPGGEDQFFMIPRGAHAHHFKISEEGGKVRTERRAGGRGIIEEHPYTVIGHDKVLHDTLYVLDAHNRAHSSGDEERIMSTELELPAGIPLEHQP
jgi:hypothetical protein